ncbi:MAG: CPBP family intramembrane metalloprotease [Chloroflexota bacterium]|nr:CPBP family intramembrane metalloprotease [Chloroflexota bacterium]MDE2909735.1 CPBP family intramembrane metalloprotease [Chloroflexota bacterium]
MIVDLPSLVYATILILAANHDLRVKNAMPLTPLLSLGLTQMVLLWANFEKLMTILNPFDRPQFDKRNPLHRAAALLVIAHAAGSLLRLLLPPGEYGGSYFPADMSGVLSNLITAALVYLALSLLGAGWKLRRDLDGVLRRLGLRLPTRRDWLAGLAAGMLIFGGMMLASKFISLTANGHSGASELFDIVKVSLPAALLVAILSSVGEEIFFRGALQPIFGLWVSSALFTLVHAQYGLSPELLILFFVSIGFGLLRKRFNTTAAIIAHASYNFAPFLISNLTPA